MSVAGVLACGAAPAKPAPPPENESPPVAVAPGAAADALQSDLMLLTKWFAGRFDNHLQVWEEKAAGLTPEQRHEHVHSIFAPVEVPALGSNVFYVKQYFDGDPSKVYRQRLYTFDIADDRDSVVLRIFAFLDEAGYTDAHLAPAKLAAVTLGQLRPTPGCEVYWRRQGDHFRGVTIDGACRVKSPRSGKTLVISDELYLDDDEIWIHDRAVDEEGKPVFGHDVAHKLKRIREFTGWAVVRVGDKADKPSAAANPDDSAFQFHRNLELHDQGQRIELKNAQGEPLGYTVELAQLVYQRTKVPVLKLAIYKTGSAKSLVYTWANPQAERIGVNLGYVQVGLTLKRRDAQ